MILVHFFAVFIFAEAGLFTKIVKICTQWKFPAIQYSNSPAPRNPLENSLWTPGYYKMQREGSTFSMVAWNGTRVGRPYPQMPCLFLQVPATACWTLVSKLLSWLSMAESRSRSVPVETGNILARNRLLLSLYQDCKDFRSHSIAVISQINVMGSHKSSSLTMDHSSHQGSWLNLQKLRLHPLHKQPQVPSSKWWGRMSSEKSEEHTENTPWSHGIPSYTFGKRIQSCRTVNRMQASYNHPSYIWTVEAKIAWLFSTLWKGGEYESPTKKQFWPASSG